MTRVLLLGGVAAIFLLSGFATSWIVRPLVHAKVRARSDGDEKSNPKLHEEMEKLRTALRQVRQLIRTDDRVPGALDAVAEAQRAILQCKGMTPIKFAEMDASAAKKALVEYRLQMIEVGRVLFDCEAKLVTGDLAGARKAYDQLKPLERSGHDRFRD